MKKKLFRVSAVAGSLAILLKGQLRFMSQYYDVTGISSDGHQHERIRKTEGVRVIPLRINRKINLREDIVSLYRLYQLFKREKPFIVHSLTPKAGLLSMMAAYAAGVPHRIHTFTGLIFPTHKGAMKKLLIFFDKVICFCATKVYPEGEGVRKDLIRYGITKKPLKVIANGNVNGVDLSYFDPQLFDKEHRANIRKELNIENSDFVFCFVGRLVFDKGIVELVTAFNEISKNHDDIKLLLVGGYEKELDPLPEHIENDIEHNPRIISVGWQLDVRPYLAIANIFVFPSYREGFPNVVLQAGAMGKFSIVTDINGSNEIVQEGYNGTIIPVKDCDALIKAMALTLKNPTKYEGFDVASRQLIAEKYDQKLVWQAKLEEYKALEIES
ncbi:glycosyltransferase family 4 protein [Pricia sp. S334]|uniref:Glycosyltransferase family 4 protein n=1 Tax=Pricia mediterranea TaxID=3076079 RepID=A0ABU3L8X3_9FLAO|nr:glycosyltransferase family 4 protein [Pricia sp. S334]MDT7830195.1 glycosyltransferase family 4 protein [Pricia sp. S334]